MNPLSIVVTLVASALLGALPRRLAAVPLLLGAAYMTRSPVLELGPASLTVVRILVLVGVLRVLTRGERVAGGMNTVDRLIILWAAVLVASSVFHTSDAWVLRAGIVWSEVGCYFLFRAFLRSEEDVVRMFRILCVALVPLALLMLYEKSVGENLFASMGGYTDDASVALRDGRFRARGPFAHAILAGTVGATCVPMALYLLRRRRWEALVGVGAAGGIVFASTSSGPMMMVLFSLAGLLLWQTRNSVRWIRWAGVAAVVALDLAMRDPVYFLMARIDVAGGSKGWHRARLIQSAIEHVDEWWLAGTDYTRHWMATGIHANERHTDITNHLLGMGVMGGLPLLGLFVLVLVASFRGVGRAWRESERVPGGRPFLSWTLGAILFGHVTNFFSISLFDQSIVFFYFVLAAIGAVQTAGQWAASTALPVPGAGSVPHWGAPTDGSGQTGARARPEAGWWAPSGDRGES